MPLLNAMAECFSEVRLFGEPALFIPVRVDANTLPLGYHAYDIRIDADSRYADEIEIARFVLADYWGTIVTRGELMIPDKGYLDMCPKDIRYNARDCQLYYRFCQKMSCTRRLD
jgi:hypothetical protein